MTAPTPYTIGYVRTLERVAEDITGRTNSLAEIRADLQQINELGNTAIWGQVSALTDAYGAVLQLISDARHPERSQ